MATDGGITVSTARESILIGIRSQSPLISVTAEMSLGRGRSTESMRRLGGFMPRSVTRGLTFVTLLKWLKIQFWVKDETQIETTTCACVSEELRVAILLIVKYYTTNSFGEIQFRFHLNIT